MPEITMKQLLEAGVHFGHQTTRWNPKMKKYIYGARNGIYIVDLQKTLKMFLEAEKSIRKITEAGKKILFVATKKQAQDIVQQEADRCSMFYVVERWLGGTLTNFSTIKKSIKRLQLLEKEGSSIYENLTKKELQMLNRERIKLSDQHRGIKDMKRLPDAIIIVDANFESIAVNEANLLEIPIIAIVDSNTDPRNIDYPIPANDDSMKTIHFIVNYIADGIVEVKGGNIDSNLSIDELNEVSLDSASESFIEENKKSIKEEVGSEETDT